MNCPRCSSNRIMTVYAKCSDLCSVTYKGEERHGYVPNNVGIGGDDYIRFCLCLECGQLFSDEVSFPIPEENIRTALLNEDY